MVLNHEEENNCDLEVKNWILVLDDLYSVHENHDLHKTSIYQTTS